MSNKKWLIAFSLIFILLLTATVVTVVVTDPFLHYHGPVDCFYYTLDNQRSQNNGLIRNLDYQGVITGTSMTENFKTSEAEALWDADFIKVPFSGATFKEVNENLQVVFDTHENINYVVRALDVYRLDDDKDVERTDLGEYPTYLYDHNIFNDVYYVFNKDILCRRSIPMLQAMAQGKEGGITSFDAYSRWADDYTFCAENALSGVTSFGVPEHTEELTDEDTARVLGNIRQNVTALAKAHPETEFFYFLPPYSMAYWGRIWENGQLKRELQVQKLVIEEILLCPNIHFYSFNNFMDVTADLSNYKDNEHYSDRISSQILQWLHDGEGLLTKENYMDYLKKNWKLYSSFDYNSLLNQMP